MKEKIIKIKNKLKDTKKVLTISLELSLKLWKNTKKIIPRGILANPWYYYGADGRNRTGTVYSTAGF